MRAMSVHPMGEGHCFFLGANMRLDSDVQPSLSGDLDMQTCLISAFRLCYQEWPFSRT